MQSLHYIRLYELKRLIEEFYHVDRDEFIFGPAGSTPFCAPVSLETVLSKRVRIVAENSALVRWRVVR